jgi:hypothetical protein
MANVVKNLFVDQTEKNKKEKEKTFLKIIA